MTRACKRRSRVTAGRINGDSPRFAWRPKAHPCARRRLNHSATRRPASEIQPKAPPPPLDCIGGGVLVAPVANTKNSPLVFASLLALTTYAAFAVPAANGEKRTLTVHEACIASVPGQLSVAVTPVADGFAWITTLVSACAPILVSVIVFVID